MDFLSKLKQKHHQSNNNLFELLPDDVILIIFNKVKDAKTLVRCFSVNKHLASLIPQTDVVSLSLIAPRSSNSHSLDRNHNNKGNFVKHVKSGVNYLATKLLQNCYVPTAAPTTSNKQEVPFSSDDTPCRRLRLFSHISYLRVEIHSDITDAGITRSSDEIFKWKARFSGRLKSWTLLCCSKKLRYFVGGGDWCLKSGALTQFKEREQRMNLSFRDAYARYRLAREMATQFATLKKVKVTDAKREGILSMTEDDIGDMRDSWREEEEGEEAVYLLQMWYVPLLELPMAKCMWKDAMFIVIRPMDINSRLVDFGFDSDTREQRMFTEGIREIMKSPKADRRAWRWNSTPVDRQLQ
ncbi:F-box protein AUF2-like [Arachis duranensis]|uniref:F-box protein AUF2-like n=1 Tax=Arachis duranensis TaxID=130453 RepID=A0A6P4DHW8_ARADU|nr:F-box protein AUF2-like [Arachis duranensis]